MRFLSSGITMCSVAPGALYLLLASPAAAAKPPAAMSQLDASPVEALQVAASNIASSVPAAEATSAVVAGAVQAIAAQNQCLTYSYDKNGNRQVETSMTFGSTATWGSSVYGCFRWNP